MTQMFADVGRRTGRILATAVALAFFAPGAPAAAQVPDGASPAAAPAVPASAPSASLTLPPLLERRESSYQRWKQTALEEPAAPPFGEVPPGVPPGMRPLEFTADSTEFRGD